MRADSGKVALSYLTGSASTIESVRASFLAQFPDFTLRNAIFESNVSRPVVAVTLTGDPQLSPDPLNGLAEFMIQSKANCMYQVLTVPKRPSRTSRFLSKKRLQSTSQRLKTQESQQGLLGIQETRTRIDPEAARRSKRYGKHFARMSAAKVLASQVVLAFWGSPDCDMLLSNAVGVLMASTSSSDRHEQLKIRYFRGEKAVKALEQALKLEHIGRSMELLPSEAAVFFHIPTIEMALQFWSIGLFLTVVTATLLNRSTGICNGRTF